MDSINSINNKLKRNFTELEELAKKQEQLLEAITEAISEKDKYVLPLKKRYVT